MSEVVVTAIFVPKEGERDALVQALKDTIPGVHAGDDGCLLYAIHDAADGTITMIEKWSSVEALDAHGSSPAVKALGGAAGPHLASPVKVTRMTPIPAGTEAQGIL